MVSLFRIIKMGFQNFWRNRWLAFATISIMVLTLLVITLSIILNLILNTTIAFVYERMDITVQLKDPIAVNDVLKYELKLKNNSQEPVSNFTLQDSLSEISQYGRIIDQDSGKVASEKISWSGINLQEGEEKTFTYKVKILPRDKWNKKEEISPSSEILPEELSLVKIVLNYTQNKEIFENPQSGEIEKLLEPNYHPLLEELKSRLQGSEEVKKLVFVSKEEALERFKKQRASRPELLEFVFGKNPFLNSLEIKVKNPNKTEGIKKIVEDPYFKPIIPKAGISYKEEENRRMVSGLLTLTNSVKKGGFILSALFILISLLIIFNTIRMAIFTRAEEIGIMKLVGASHNFIRGPFIFEGMIYGFVATLISITFLYPLLILISPRLSYYFAEYGQSLVSFFSSNILKILILQITIGVLIGVISSLLALRKYLKVA